MHDDDAQTVWILRRDLSVEDRKSAYSIMSHVRKLDAVNVLTMD